jgi:hypothetical protein
MDGVLSDHRYDDLLTFVLFWNGQAAAARGKNEVNFPVAGPARARESATALESKSPAVACRHLIETTANKFAQLNARSRRKAPEWIADPRRGWVKVKERNDGENRRLREVEEKNQGGFRKRDPRGERDYLYWGFISSQMGILPIGLSPAASLYVADNERGRRARKMAPRKLSQITIGAALLGTIAAGCAGGPLSSREKGALVGTGLGAAAGGIVGSAVGRPAAGALIGGGLGLTAGGLVGDQIQGQEIQNQKQDQQIRRQQSELDRRRQQIERLQR